MVNMSTTKQKPKPSAIHYISYTLLIASFVGFLDATYLTILHYQNVIPPCTITNGCETVLTSKFATIGALPVSLFGAGFYLTVLVLFLVFKETKDKLILWILVGFANAGFVVSLVLLGIQFGILRTACQYCLLSEISSAVIFATTLTVLKDYLDNEV